MVAVARQHKIAEPSAFEVDVIEGLGALPKRIPAKYFYDGAGSQLFERITELPEYYPTRSEMQILRDHGYPQTNSASRSPLNCQRAPG